MTFLPSHSACHTWLSHWFNFMTVYFAPLLVTLKTAAIHPTSSILHPPQKASPPVMRSHLLPPPWPSCSQAAAARPRPPPWPSCSSPAGTTLAAMIVVTLTPPGLTTGKAIGQAIGHWTATLTGPATTQATLTPLGLIPGRATGPLVKAKEAAQASTILRRTMARSSRQRRQQLKQQRIGSSGPFRRSWGSLRTMMRKLWLQASPRRLPHIAQSLNPPSNVKMGHRANKLPRWSQTPPPWS